MAAESDLPRGNWKNLAIGFDAALARLPEALIAEGFGIITQIDIQETFKAKLGVDFRRYRIFGACNPALAHAALRQDLRVGVFLPCNVVLYEDSDGQAVVGAVDAMQMMAGAAEAAELAELARNVTDRLERVLARL